MKQRLLAIPFLVAAALLVTGSAGAQTTPSPATGPHPRTPVDQIPAGGEMQGFTLVGHNALIDTATGLPRGQNGGITAVRDCVYVGTNIGMEGTAIVDLADPTQPALIGELPGRIPGRANGVEAIEAVADQNLLVELLRVSAVGFDPPQDQFNVGMQVWDVSDCRKPSLVSNISFPNANEHYMTLWRDPNQPNRVLADVTSDTGTPDDGIDIRVYDLTGCPATCNPQQIAEWGLSAQFEIPPTLEIPYDGGVYRPSTQTHDATWSLDGTRMYLGQTHFGFFELDTTPLGKNQPCDGSAPKTPEASGHCITILNPDLSARVAPFGVGVGTVHAAVRLPGRPYASLQHESGSCPWSGIDLVYVGNQESFLPGAPGTGLMRGDLRPKLVGSFSIPENQLDRCPQPNVPAGPNTFGPAIMRNGLMSVHNVIAFPDLEIATWYSGGLRAIDVTNPFMPFEVGYFFNKPEADARWCGFDSVQFPYCGPVEKDANGLPFQQRPTGPLDIVARSYPIVMNGYVVYSDANSGLYVLKYNGPHADEIPSSGLCISHNPNVTSPGFEPCPPYRT
jgi:hypothetical protein